MLHAFVVAKFNPTRTARWLSPSGQQTAADIETFSFWALRFDLKDEADLTIRDWSRYSPPVLCAVSSQPSPIPIPNPSLTLRPKIACDSGELSTDDGHDDPQLFIEPPIECYSPKLHEPLYLHTAPILRPLWVDRQPIHTVLHTLTADSLQRFKAIAKTNSGLLQDYWEREKKAQLARLLPRYQARTDSDTTQWSLFSGFPKPTEIFGRLNNPRAYAFDFFYEGVLPLCDGPATIYREISLYAQVCKDYDWERSEQTIAWVRDVRADTQNHANDADQTYSSAQILAPTHARVRSLLRKDATFKDCLQQVTFLAAVPLESFDSDSDECASNATSDLASGKSHAGDPGWFLEHDLPFAFPYIPLRYGTAPLPSLPAVVVLDLFGVILDREGAVRRALEQWLVYAYPPIDANEATRLYIEFEALAIREQISSGRATSVPASARTALNSLAGTLRIPQPLRPRFLNGTLSAILRPPMFDDVEAACEELACHGSAIVVLVPFSFSTLAVLRSAFSRRLLDLVHFYPREIPLYNAIPAGFFPEMLKWCEGLQAPGSSSSASGAGLAAENVVVVSGGVGRVLIAVMKRLKEVPLFFNKNRHPQPPVYPTVHVRRPGGVECHVDFYLGDHNPVPSLVVGGLEEMTRALFGAV
ncbi:hypothetical protein C8Q77DRAFT_1132729 [Trametes polyzona]|nr:hypothetical protein C8Q77DRAFT_1132729 [Trametes polyzona]